MGIIDVILGLFGGKNENLIQYQKITDWIESQGGVQGIITKFRDGGLGEIVESWSEGNSSPVSVEQIQTVLGSPAIQELANKLGINLESTSALIAGYLPKIISGVSRDGQMPDLSSLLSAGQSFLKK